MEWNRSRSAVRRVSLFAAVGMGLFLGACTTLGTGSGSTSPGDQPVSFAWTSKDGGVTGTMSATLADGGAFTGPYLELTSISPNADLSPMWAGWGSLGWGDWQWGLDPVTTNYSGKVVANLQGPNAQRMRCRFDLNDPISGMGGGGQGKCQVAGGPTVDAVFARA
jgi:hypothetical protein